MKFADRRHPAERADAVSAFAPLFLLVLATVLFAVQPAVAASNTPAAPVPEARWGNPATMRPWAILGDSTHYDGRGGVPTASTPIWFAADLAGNYLFSATGKGVMVHDLTTDPTNPTMIGYTYMVNAVPTFFQSDLKFYIYDISAPDTNPSVFATSGAGHGALIWGFNGGNPTVHYQDYQHGTDSDAVWAGHIGSKDWAFYAAQGRGVTVYDLTAAQAYNRCDTANGGCGDVYAGAIPVGGTPYHVHGAGNFLATALGRNGIEIWNVANPRLPVKVVSADPGGLYVSVALWQSGAKYYLAVLDFTSVGGSYLTKIYDVSCLGSGTCATANPLSQPIASLSSNGTVVDRLTVSQSAGRTYLYVGEFNRFLTGDQNEFLWDVTTPTSADELTPQNPLGLGYWGWYYSRNDTGFQNMAPMEAVVHNGYVYRAAWTILDVHQILGAAPPVADFTWSPQPVYAGQTVAFADKSSGGPSSWFWTFSGAGASSSQSTVANPQVTFSQAGSASVTLTATNGAGPSTPVTKSVPVLDPTPVVGSVSASPTAPLVCQQLTFTANGVTGRDPLSYSWILQDGNGDPVVPSVTGSANPFVVNTSGLSAGVYKAQVTVSNTAGSATKTSATVSLAIPPTLGISAGPTTDPFQYGTVQFHATTAGGATWTWDYGDGTTPEVFTSQSEGENPVHNYSQTGTFTATLTVDNCIATAVSASVQVTVTQINPLKVDQFAAHSQCQIGGGAGGCFTVNKAVTFDQIIGGSPDKYEYDWQGNGTWIASTVPILTHTYSTAGTFVPKVRVTRGTEPSITVANGCTSSQLACNGTSITVASALPASISVSSSTSSTTVGQSIGFNASASNCTPNASGWSWSTSGGTLNGSGSSVSISWSTTGTKTVSATNSACLNAVGSRTVSVTSSSGGGGGGGGGTGGGGGNGSLVAAFNVTPASPTAGVPAAFDSSPSAGTPTSYTWTFGDGDIGTGKTISHTFAEAGTYQVKLSISAPGNCQSQVGGLSGICTDDITKNVVVAAANIVTASFEDDVDCGGGQIGGSFCSIATGDTVSFTDTSDGQITGRSWDFGDGSSSAGKNPSHSWAEPGTYVVKLTVQGDGVSDTATKTYLVTGDPPAQNKNVVLPWIAQGDASKALQQESDLYVYNPGPGALTVQVTFRKQGLPEPDPPHVTRTLQENQTLYLADVMTELFDRSNIKGFLLIEPMDGDAQPIVTSFNRTHDGDRLYGQVIPGVELSDGTSARAAGTDHLHLVGLNDNPDRLGYFGITNPTDHRVDYDLQFFNSVGQLIGSTTEPSAVAAFGQKQYQVEEIRQQFGVESLEDYRVMVTPSDGSGMPIPFGANLRLGSKDPSFVRVGKTDSSDTFIIGALDSLGLNDSVFQSDLVLANTDESPVNVRVTFTGVGPFTEPSDALEQTLPARDTTRIVDIISQWDTDKSVGVLRIESDNPDGIYPVVQAESYEVSDPSSVYGQFMPGLTLADAAEPGTPRSLVGLRQDADFLNGTRSTLWVYNPGDDSASYTLSYFALDGTKLGEDVASLGSGKLRQVNPGFHPLPAEGAPDGFVVRVDVSKGKLLVAGQVVNQFNDPAYIVGR